MLLCYVGIAHAQAESDDVTRDVHRNLEVSIVEKEPFVFMQNNKVSGFAIDIWEAVARENEWSYSYERAQSLVELLRTQKKATADIAIGHIAITEDREQIMEFSEPILAGGLQIIVHHIHPLRLLVDALFVPQALFLLLLLACGFVIGTFLTWISRLRQKTGKITLATAAWIVITLGSFGKALPRETLGRIALLFWMCAATMCLSLYIASVSSALTSASLSHAISSHHDLHGKKVGALKGSIALAFMREKGIDAILYSDQSQIYRDVKNELIDAAILDTEQVQYYIANAGDGRIKAIEGIFQHKNYGFALPIGSDLQNEIDIALDALRENGQYKKIHDKWFK